MHPIAARARISHRLFSARRLARALGRGPQVVLTFALALAAGAPAFAQMPDSPTGRMAGALAELAASGAPDAVETFVGERVAKSLPDSEVERLREELVALHRECAGGEPVAARKRGPFEATLTLELPGGRCEIDYAVVAEAPHGLAALGIGVMMGRSAPEGPALEIPPGDDATLATAVDRQLREMAAADEFSGVVLLARGDTPIFHRAYGPADRSAGRANTVDTRFDVGSITKLLTRIAIAQLASAGKLELDATVQSVLPDYPNRAVGERITLQQLLDHSSGLGDIFNEAWESADRSKFVAPRDFFPLFVEEPLLFEPGASQAYSNAGFVLLGAIVERISGRPYTEYLAENVFAPAGMENSGFAVRDGSDPSLAIGYSRDGSEGELEPNLGLLPIAGCPAGSSSHTAADLLKLDRALRGGKLLDPAWTAWVYSGTLEPDPEAGWAIGFAGGGPGVSTVIEAGAETAVVVLSNLDPPTATRIGSQLARALRER